MPPIVSVTPKIVVQSNDFDLTKEVEALTADRTDVGALVSFLGLCRDENHSLEALELEHYPGMAETEITRIAKKAIERWPLQGLTVIHRFGRLRPGEQIVLVAAASAHRQAAFEAADFLMDFLKNHAPFWKKQHFASTEAPSWLEAKQTDEEALLRWNK
ncbi:MAG: molybdenum cofactor biosynthesis protein MoaE [Rhodobacteraceae bacterium]|nr:molybdenum cofactor biosynthesis protein MoaE [Paracoccaceae bacterium]